MLIFVSFLRTGAQPLLQGVKEKYNNAKTDLEKHKIIYRFLNNYKDDPEMISEAANLTNYFKTINDPAALDYIQLALGGYLSHTGDFNRVLSDAMRILSRSEKRKDNYGQMLANKVISLAYYAARDLEKTITYDKKTLALAQIIGDTYDLSSAYNNLGADFADYGYADSGIGYARLGVKYAKQLNDSALLSTTLGTLGENYMSQKKYDSARVLLHEALQLAKSWDILNYVWTLNDCAQLFLEINQPDSAKVYTKKAVPLAIEKGFKPQLLRAYKYLYAAYEKTGPIDSSLKFLQLIVQTKDSLFSVEKTKQLQAINLSEQAREQEAAQEKAALQNKIKLYAMLGVLFVFFTIGILLFRNNKQKQKANLFITDQKQQVEKALAELKATQSQLIQSEKMASLGELTAGIAHEIQNPLNFVNNFSEVSNELIDEMKEELSKGNYDDAKDIADDVKQNLEKINHHGKRADAIVKGMLQHSRSSSATNEPTDINKLADEYLRLAYHGLRAKDKSFNATMKTDFDQTIGNINIIPQDMGRVILNLITNAFYVVDEKKKSGIEGYEPTVTISTKSINGKVEIKVVDNGNGIPQKLLDKIFQPFFSTKPTGQGTGLGLSLSYDIVKAHGGELKVETKPARAGTNREGKGSEFVIQLPV